LNSLRSRIILGSALVALVPLAIAMIVLSARIQATVRGQAAERLGAALGRMEAQLRSDGERTAGKLEILARDPSLKRLYLVQPLGVRDLSDYLAEKRFLLALDFLEVADSSGALVADGVSAAAAQASPASWRPGGASERGAAGVAVVHVEGAPALALAAWAPIRYQSAIVGRLRGGVLMDSAFLARLKETSGVDLALRDANGALVAATLEGVNGRGLPAPGAVAPVRVAGRSYWSRGFALEPGPGSGPAASVLGLVSTAAADQTIAALRLASGVLALLGLAIAVVLGWVWSLQVTRPVERLARFSERIAQGHWDEPIVLRSVRELQPLVSALDRMRANLVSYRDRLVASERQAAWSQMARLVAHEIKNPLTPIAVSVADLKRSFERDRADFPEILDQAARTITEQVESLKRILQEFSDFARLPDARFAPCRLSGLWSDLATLYGREIAAGRLGLAEPAADPEFSADPGQLRQALVNLIKNGLEAVEAEAVGRVEVSARVEDGALEISVTDTGPALSAEQRARLFTPDFTTKLHGSGLGLTIVERIVREHRGTIAVEAGAGRGTRFRVRIPRTQEA
jgi:two-component system nitrogen regulation sensor histidine kinase NtrY